MYLPFIGEAADQCSLIAPPPDTLFVIPSEFDVVAGLRILNGPLGADDARRGNALLGVLIRIPPGSQRSQKPKINIATRCWDEATDLINVRIECTGIGNAVLNQRGNLFAAKSPLAESNHGIPNGILEAIAHLDMRVRRLAKRLKPPKGADKPNDSILTEATRPVRKITALRENSVTKNSNTVDA